jgi:hypothetical protein
MAPGTLNIGRARGLAGAASVAAGVETGGAGAGGSAGISTEMTGGELVAGAFVLAVRLISPGPGTSAFAEVCAGRRLADEKKHRRTIMVESHDFPPYKDVKKVISLSPRI